jgi:hypothetical protein
MELKKPGKSTSAAEVTNISQHGFWILANEKEYFLSFEDFPWFKDAKISQITDFEFMHGHLLHWPQLDVDLSLEIIENPEKYSIIARDRQIPSINQGH